MNVQFNVRDFLDRAEAAYPERVALVDEPNQPASPWVPLTFAGLAARARAQAAGLDRLGVGRGERVAVVSHNASRLLTSFYGVCGWGRILVPINFRLAAAEVEFIVEHSGASLLLIDPELEGELAGIDGPPRLVLGAESDEILFDEGVDPRPWDADEQATATINYTSGTTARPKGVQLTHRNCWVNAAMFGWHVQLSDQDVYLHTLPMFHANGWGIPWATAAMGCTQIVVRKVDGAEILRRVGRHDVSLLCAAPAVVNAVLDALPAWDQPIPGRDRTRVVVAGAPPPSRTIERIETDGDACTSDRVALGQVDADAVLQARQAALANLRAQRVLQDSIIANAEADLAGKRAQAEFAAQDEERYRSLALSAAGSRQSAQKALADNLNPQPRSGRQEEIENLLMRSIYTDRI